MKIALAGDRRMIFAAEAFCRDGAECALLTSSVAPGRPYEQSDDLRECFYGADAVIMPNPPYKNGFLNAPLCEKRYTRAETGSLFGAATVLCPGEKYDYAADEGFLKENARLTAECALGLIITGTDGTLRGMNAVVAGAGRIGSELARLLKLAGASVCVLARGSAAREEAAAKEFCAAGFDECEAPLESAGVLANTVPCRVFSGRALSLLPPGALYIELASAPGGADRAEVEACGAVYLPAPGLPGRFAPRAAGEAVWRAAKSILAERRMLL